MHTVALVLACLVCALLSGTLLLLEDDEWSSQRPKRPHLMSWLVQHRPAVTPGHGRRMKSTNEKMRGSSYAWHQNARVASLAEASAHSLADFDQLQSKGGASAPKASAFAPSNVAPRPVTWLGSMLALRPPTGQGNKLAVTKSGTGRAELRGDLSKRLSMMTPSDIFRVSLTNRFQLSKHFQHADSSLTNFEAALQRLSPADELRELREEVRELDKVMAAGFRPEDFAMMQELRSRDPATISASLRRGMSEALKGERYEEAAKYKDQLRTLTQYLPQYQLAGIWNGSIVAATHSEEDKPLDSGPVRIFYDGQTLVARDVNGGVFFTADVSVMHQETGRFFDWATSGGEHLSAPKWAQAPGQPKATVKTRVGTRPQWAYDEAVLQYKQSANRKYSKTTNEVDYFRGEGTINSLSVPGQLYLFEDDAIGFLFVVPGKDGKKSRLQWPFPPEILVKFERVDQNSVA